MGHAKSIDPSNYVVRVTPDRCKACGLCVRRCPMDAIQLKFSTQSTNKFRKAVEVDTDVCIGCGVCVHKCPSESITLTHRDTVTEPPETGRELGRINGMAILATKEEERPGTRIVFHATSTLFAVLQVI